MKYDFTDHDIELIKTALNVLAECRQEEVRWANNDPDITECSVDDLNDIDAIFDKIYCVFEDDEAGE